VCAHAGVYLVRFGGKAEHPFTVSVIISNQIQHKRVHHVWGSGCVVEAHVIVCQDDCVSCSDWAVAADGHTVQFASFEALLKVSVMPTQCSPLTRARMFAGAAAEAGQRVSARQAEQARQLEPVRGGVQTELKSTCVRLRSRLLQNKIW
jgi:hypothetical protein